MVKISIDGNLSCGKSVYLKMLEHDGYEVHQHNLPDPRCTLQYCINSLNCYAQEARSNSKIQFYEGSPLTIKHIYGSMITDSNDSQSIVKIYDEIGWIPDIIIYLFCSPCTCLNRYRNRHSKPLLNPAKEITLDDLKQLHLNYELLYNDLDCPIPLLYKVNSQENIEAVYHNLLDIITHIQDQPTSGAI